MSLSLKSWPIKSRGHLEAVLGVRIDEINAIIEDLNVKKEKTKFYYSYISRKKKNGKVKEREISPARFRLSYIQDRIKDRILNTIPLLDHIHGGRKNHDGITNAKEHQGKNHHFSTDIKDFFPYIANEKVYAALILLGFSPDISRMLARLMTFKGHIPQGASTSTGMANLVFYFEVDVDLIKIFEGKNITFNRFVDDLNCSAQYDFKDLSKLVLEQIHKAGFLHSHRKTVYKQGKIDTTGANVQQNQMKAPKSIVKKLTDKNRSKESKEAIIKYIKRVEMA